MSIRLISDLHDAVAVINRSFETVANERGYSRETVPTFPAFIGVEQVASQIQNGLNLFGYFEHETLVGTIGIRKTSRIGIFQIERLAVVPEFRHKKLGRQLMIFAENEILKQKGSIVEVEIVQDNDQLRTWYFSQGFQEIRIDQYGHLPFDVGVLQKRIVT